MKYLSLSLLLMIFFFSCKNDKTIDKEDFVVEESVQDYVKYAKGFSIETFSDYKVLTISNAWKGEKTIFQYILYRNEKPLGFEDAVFVKTPIKTIACLSLTHLAFIDKLNQNKSIIALSGCDYVSNLEIINRIKTDKIKEIGKEQQLNYEMLIDNKPDLIMAYGIDESSKKNLTKMKELGLSVVLNAEYMENHPLGQAEWIKFVAAFYELDSEGDSIFSLIEKEYLELKKQVAKIESKPSVFLGMPWNGVWYMAGGESFQAQLLRDAGANYLWANNEEKSNFTIDKEVIIDRAIDADYWINLNSYTTINEVVACDTKFSKFKSVKKNQLFNNNKRLNISGGNDYWESGIVNPQIVLKDLITIFHPEVLNHELFYYKKLD
ncbi:ABC transporter substrate-binding protein [Vicingus serpentipes]|uniref:ABC transporter substrate-binding protein n=1 Tax=Vicingus serpentipes TaxID=1926625 RepID=A0A5C6RVM3_9FLAO|nr:ABC transporter substrate-binding protein [Vicingus serpentipes]TXB65939.1 ABC transporter substrate-binding protein [Vicingus serpentipes]